QLRAVVGVADQAGGGRGVEERGVHCGTTQLVGVGRGAVRIPCTRRRPALAGGVPSARLTRVPLNPVVVELDVEVVRSDVAAVDQHYLEVVQTAVARCVAADAGPGRG